VSNPTDAELQEWAAGERRRREAWLRGPSDTEKAIWAQRERERRALVEHANTSGSAASPGGVLRQLQLATEGAISLLLSHSLRDAFESLRRSGREWEDKFNPPTHR
jgi:hypothetical protein